jgi:hypothetical protein
MNLEDARKLSPKAQQALRSVPLQQWLREEALRVKLPKSSVSPARL